MSDVTRELRLRTAMYGDSVAGDAADEIERLRAERDRLAADLDYAEQIVNAIRDECATLDNDLAEALGWLRVLTDGLDEHDDGTYSGELRTAICHAKMRATASASPDPALSHLSDIAGGSKRHESQV